jgi:hypothetical protein
MRSRRMRSICALSLDLQLMSFYELTWIAAGHQSAREFILLKGWLSRMGWASGRVTKRWALAGNSERKN